MSLAGAGSLEYVLRSWKAFPEPPKTVAADTDLPTCPFFTMFTSLAGSQARWLTAGTFCSAMGKDPDATDV